MKNKKNNKWINIDYSNKKWYHPTKRIAEFCAWQCINAWGTKFLKIAVEDIPEKKESDNANISTNNDTEVIKKDKNNAIYKTNKQNN